MAVESTTGVNLSDAMILANVPLGDWLVIAPVALPILAGAVLLMFRHYTRTQGMIAIAALALLLAVDIGLLVRVLDQGPVVMTMGRWLPPFGIAFAADALGATLAAASALVALVAAVFSLFDIDATGRRYGFYPFLLLMMAGVSGSFLTGDIFNLYVWFEVFLISSFGLIILGSEPKQIDGATKYAVLNLVATTLFLIATGLLYGAFGTLNMADIARKAAGLRETAPLMTLGVMYLLAFGMKAAAFPVNFWLPASYHTPRIVTGALFGGLLTKVGIYALLRTEVMLFAPERAALAELISWIAAATMIIGVLGALSQSDIRRVLGFIVVSGIGVMLAGIAISTPLGISGTIVYAVHSMIVMTALYILAGVMRALGGSYSLHELGGLYRQAPLLAAFALLLFFSVAGLPPGSGLWPKVMLVRASLDDSAWWLGLAILASGLLTTIAMGRVFILAFWRPSSVDAQEREPAAAPLVGYVSLGVLTAAAFAIGIYPEPLVGMADMAAAGLLDASGYIDAVFPAGVR